MRTRNTFITGLVAAAAAGALALGGAGVASAAPPPELSLKLVGTTDIQASWDTHGRAGCDLHQTGFPTAGLPSPSGQGPVVTLPASLTAWIECPDGSSSVKHRYYGPRSPLNDLRTQFNESTGDMFGS